jgi:dephospho-CoA kinase
VQVIGITGLYCAGKNFCAALLQNEGIPVLDVDKLGHAALVARRDDVIARFGKSILTETNGGTEIDRKLLGKKVFGRPEELRALEAIVHPEVFLTTQKWLDEQAANGEKLAVINAALLHKFQFDKHVFDKSQFDQSRFDGKFSLVIIVRAPFLIRLARALKRDKLPLAQTLKRLFSQKDLPYGLWRGGFRARAAKLFAPNTDIRIVGNGVFPAPRGRLLSLFGGCSEWKRKNSC